MLRRIMLLCAAILVLLMTAPTSAQDDLGYYRDNRIRFEYSYQLASRTERAWVPAESDPNTPTGAMPEYTEITLETQDGDTRQKIYIYPVLTFPTDPNQPFAQALATLQTVLAEKPDAPESLPMLPIVTAMPYFQTQIQYIDFVNGSGVRYIAAAGQDASPITNQDLFYTFQGLSSDGAYYIAAVFPVTTSVLPDTITEETSEGFATAFDVYLTSITAHLSVLVPQDFTPNLNLMDAAMTSIEIVSPAATVITPGDVASVRVEYATLAFDYSAAFASRVEVDEIAPFIDTEGMSMYGSQPGYTRLTFINYPITLNRIVPQIYIYPVDSFPASDSVSDQQLELIRTFLASDEPLTSRLPALGQEESIPMLPMRNAAQVLVAQPQRIDFQNGSGVRFISTYAQAPYPVTNENLLYQFIGMTSDGRYVVAAQFPITASVLPDTIDHATFDFAAFDANFQTVLSQTLADLDSLDAQGYNPNLTLLDAMMQSLVVGE